MISVVIPAYNEEKTLPLCLDSLLKQTYKGSWEVILVDNNSTDKTGLIANSYKGTLPIRVVKETKKGRGYARGRGFDEAKGEIIFTSDADTLFFPAWLELFAKPFENEDVIAVTGSAKINDNTLFCNMLFNSLHPYLMGLYRLAFGHYWLSGFSFAIRKKVYSEVGGLKRDLNALDDIDLGFRIKHKGTIFFIKEPRVTMSGRRFKPHFFGGLLSYIKPFIQVALLKRADFSMSNSR